MIFRKNIYLYILLVFLLLYSFFDITSSKQAGFRDVSRINVYIALLSVLSIIWAYVVAMAPRFAPPTTLKMPIILLTIWLTLIEFFRMTDIWTSAVTIALSLWWFGSYLFFATYPNRTPQGVKNILIFFFVMTLFYIWGNIFLRYNIMAAFNKDFAISGYAYTLVLLTPFLLLINNKMIKIVSLLVVAGVVYTSLKRGAIVSFTGMFIAYLFTGFVINKNIKGIIYIIVFLAVLPIFLYYGDQYSGGVLFERFSLEEMESGSDRDVLRASAFSILRQRNIIELLCGSGYLSSGMVAFHNEWLEFLVDYGVIGFLMYMFLYIKIIAKYFHLLFKNSRYAMLTGMVVAYILSTSMYGSIYFNHNAFYLFSFLGLLEYLTYEESALNGPLMYQPNFNRPYMR